METENTHNLTKKLLAGSQLVIMHPDLSGIVMQRILLAERKKMIRHTLLSCFLGLSVLGIAIFLAITSMQLNRISPAQVMNVIFRAVSANQFLVLPLIVLFILQRLLRRKDTSYPVTASYSE